MPGSSRCKYHGWRYGLDGGRGHVTNEEQFFDLDKSTLRMPRVHCEVFAGFIFVNLGEDAEPLRDFLGERIVELESYPFEKMTAALRVQDPDQRQLEALARRAHEWYHPAYVHGRFIDPDVSKAEKMVPPVDAYHYDLFRPHMLTSVPGPPPLPPREPGTARSRRHATSGWVYRLFRAGLFGPDDFPTSARCPTPSTRARSGPGATTSSGCSPTSRIQVWARNYYITYQYWPEAVDSHSYELDIYFPEPANAPAAAGPGARRRQHHRVRDAGLQHRRGDPLGVCHPRQQVFHLSRPGADDPDFHKVIRERVAETAPRRRQTEKWRDP